MIQNEQEIKTLVVEAKKLSEKARQARNHASLEEIQQVQAEMQDIQHRIQVAQGKAINGSDISSQDLVNAQLELEEFQHEVKRPQVNLEAQQDNVH